MARLRLAVLISGRGSNLAAIIDAIAAGRAEADIAIVISNRSDAAGLERAAEAGIQTCIVSNSDFADREAFDAELAAKIDAAGVDLVVLAGFMRILTPGFIQHFADRILNIHPSLLPDFKGLDTHRRAIEAGRESHGASVHFVNEELDSGTVVLQAKVAVHPDDDEARLAGRVLEQEHIIYPMCIQWIADGRLVCRQEKVLFDGEILERPLVWEQGELKC